MDLKIQFLNESPYKESDRILALFLFTIRFYTFS